MTDLDRIKELEAERDEWERMVVEREERTHRSIATQIAKANARADRAEARLARVTDELDNLEGAHGPMNYEEDDYAAGWEHALRDIRAVAADEQEATDAS